jgi:hypothetical protein
MAYLRLGLFAEGPRDYALLVPLLRRLTEQVCREEAQMVIDVEDVQGIDAPPRFRHADRATRILEAARLFWGGACILFIHADGAGEPVAKEAEQVTPGAHLVTGEMPGCACVAVVPVREVEAWTLVDGDALRDAFGTNLDDADLAVFTRPRDAERVLDPKAHLEAAFARAVGASARRRLKPINFYARIGERVDLSRLSQVPAFAQMKQSLRRGLQHMGMVGGR